LPFSGLELRRASLLHATYCGKGQICGKPRVGDLKHGSDAADGLGSHHEAVSAVLLHHHHSLQVIFCCH
jgi:hypothetical protein